MSLSDGLYKVEFKTPLGVGYGAIVLQDGKIRGGDSGLFYVGEYQQDGDNFSAQVRTDRHSILPDGQSVFGVDKVNIALKGLSQGDTAKVTGSAEEAPGLTFQANLTKIAD